MHDEGPSPEDIERFSHEDAFCPACGEEIWDQAEFCPACRAPIGGQTTFRPPAESWFRNRWMVLVAIIALIAFLLLIIP